MTDRGSAPDPEAETWPEIDTSVASPARVYDYLGGGTANFEVDRKAAELAFGSFPGGVAATRLGVRAHRALIGQIVTYLAAEEGIRQFLDIGTGIPGEVSAHAVAQQIAPESRVVYVDNDPIVLAHAHRLLTSTPEGACAYLLGDLRDPETILRKAAETLDFSKPTAILLFGVLHFFADADQPFSIVGRLLAALPPGSYLAIGHLAADEASGADETFSQLSQRMSDAVTLRSMAGVARFFDGLELVEPGIVPLHQWRPRPDAPASPPPGPPIWFAVGRKR